MSIPDIDICSQWLPSNLFGSFTVSCSHSINSLTFISMSRIRHPVWKCFFVYWLLIPLLYNQFYLLLWPRSASISYGLWDTPWPNKTSTFQVRLKDGVIPSFITYIQDWPLTLLSLNSYLLFSIHLKYHISESYKKVIFLCSQSIDLILSKLSRQIAIVSSTLVWTRQELGNELFSL